MTKEKAAKISRKETRQRIFEKMSAALEEYKANLKEKRFTATLKKASRQLANALDKGLKKGKAQGKKVKVKAKKLKAGVKQKVEPAV